MRFSIDWRIVAGAALMATSACGGKSPAPQASASANAPASAASDGSCKPGEARLPGSGLCESAALAMMPAPEAIDEDGCKWVVSETGLPDDDWAIYRSLACKTGKTRLEFAGGAHKAELVLAESAWGGPVSDEPAPYAVVSLIPAEPDAKTAIRDFARAAMDDAKAAAGCSVQLAKVRGWPGDALVVDVSEAEAAKAPRDEPRSACGPYGLDEDAAVFWRPSGKYALWFNLGQDTPEVDAGSFVIVKRGGKVSF